MISPLQNLLIERWDCPHVPLGRVLVAELPLGRDADLPPEVMLQAHRFQRRPGFLVVSGGPITEEQTCRAIAQWVTTRERAKECAAREAERFVHGETLSDLGTPRGFLR